MKDYYEELEVSRNASPDVINKAYKVLAKKYHPDTTTENKQEAEERFKKISEAYETLSNEQKRLDYNSKLEPEVSKEDYLNVLKDNQKLKSEINNLKDQINHFANNTTNTTYSNRSPNINYHVYTTSNRHVNSNPNVKNKSSYSYFDLIKYKIKNLFKNIFAAILTVVIIFVIISVLLYIPTTRDFLLEDLNFKTIFDILH